MVKALVILLVGGTLFYGATQAPDTMGNALSALVEWGVAFTKDLLSGLGDVVNSLTD